MTPRFLALSLLSLSSVLAAQQVQPVLRENDVIGGEPVRNLLRSVIGDDGVWHGMVLKNTPVHDGNAEILRDGVVVAAEGDALVGGGHLVALYSLEGGTDNLCMLAYLQSFGGVAFSDSALVRAGRVVLQGDQPPAVVGLPPGTVCNQIETLAANAHDTALVIARLNGNPADRALIQFRFDASGASVVRQLLLRTGDVLSDGSVVANFSRATLSEHGDWLVQLTTTAQQDRLVGGVREYLRSGTPSPIPGRNVLQILGNYSLNDLGELATAVVLDGSLLTDNALLAKGAVVAQEGDLLPPVVPPIPGGTLAGFGQVRIANSGNVYWQGLVSYRHDHGSFLRDGVAFLQAGASQIAGELVTGFANVIDNFEVSPSGRFWIGQVELQTTGRAYVTADFGAAVPLPGCTPNPGALRVTGGLALAGQTLGLTLDGPAQLGSPAFLYLSLGLARPGQPCGVSTGFGELLISPALRVGSLPAGNYAGAALPVPLVIPASAALVDVDVFAQGAFLQGTGPMLTNAMAIEIGAP